MFDFSLFSGSFIGYFVGLFLGHYCGKKDIQQQAVEKGFAEYDSTTGEWRWKK